MSHLIESYVPNVRVISRMNKYYILSRLGQMRVLDVYSTVRGAEGVGGGLGVRARPLDLFSGTIFYACICSVQICASVSSYFATGEKKKRGLDWRYTF